MSKLGRAATRREKVRKFCFAIEANQRIIVLSRPARASLTEDSYGAMQRDIMIPRIPEATFVFLTTLEDAQKLHHPMTKADDSARAVDAYSGAADVRPSSGSRVFC